MNNYYNSPADLAPGTKARAGDINTIDQSVDAAFDKLPDELALKTGTVNFAANTSNQANAYAVTLASGIKGYTDGLEVKMRPVMDNTGACTLNVNGLGNIAIKRQDGGDPGAGELLAASPITLVYVASANVFRLPPTGNAQVTAAGVFAKQAGDSAAAAAQSATQAAASAGAAATARQIAQDARDTAAQYTAQAAGSRDAAATSAGQAAQSASTAATAGAAAANAVVATKAPINNPQFFGPSKFSSVSGKAVIFHNMDDVNGGFTQYSLGQVIAGYFGTGSALIGATTTSDLAIRTETGAVIFGKSSIETARIDSTGNLLIGATVSGNGERLYIASPNGSRSVIRIGQAAQRDWYIGMSTPYNPNFSITDASAGLQRMTFDTAGRVGIATTVPNTLLELRTDDRNNGPVITLNNRSNVNSDPNDYFIGGIWGAALRDVRDPAYVGGIDFLRKVDANGLSSKCAIIFNSIGGGTLVEARTNGERARLNEDGHWLVGTTTPSGRVTSYMPSILPNFAATGKNSGHIAPDVSIGRSSSGEGIGAAPAIQFDDGTATHSRMIQAGNGSLQFFGTGGGGWAEHARLDPIGNWKVGYAGTANYHVFSKGSSVTTPVMDISYSATFFVGEGYGYNGSACTGRFMSNLTTGRSINTAGTINANGSDYAEYYRKAAATGEIAKGQIVGIDANGHLVDRWDDAISFLIKSTDPSLVGGDVWGNKDSIGKQRPIEPAFASPEYTGSHEPGPAPAQPGEPVQPEALKEIDPPDELPALILPEDPTEAEEAAYKMLTAQQAAVFADRMAAYQAELERRENQYQVDMAQYVADLALYHEKLERYQVDKAAYDLALATFKEDQEAHQAKVERERLYFDAVIMPAYQGELAQFEACLEAARQRVDRMAYCGQVPVNVTGAVPGQYVVPVQDGDGIAGKLVNKSAMTLAQYMAAVGIVQNILPDGRANVRVKPV